jgi:hypothetical protein
VAAAYKAAIGRWGMKPRDFWALAPTEFWWMVEAKKPKKTYAGGMTEHEVAELYGEMKSWGAFNG